MNSITDLLAAAGRLLMSALFIESGYRKLMNVAGVAKSLAAKGLAMPDVTVWIVIAVELIGGIAVLVGYRTRWAAAVLAVWSVVTGVAVHLATASSAADAAVAANNMIHFYKNIAMAGGFLYVVAFGAGAISLDGRLRRG